MKPCAKEECSKQFDIYLVLTLLTELVVSHGWLGILGAFWGLFEAMCETH